MHSYIYRCTARAAELQIQLQIQIQIQIDRYVAAASGVC